MIESPNKKIYELIRNKKVASVAVCLWPTYRVYCVLFSLFRSFMMNWVTGIHISCTLRGLLELLKCFQTPPRWSSAPSACPSLSRLTRTITNQGRRWNFGLYQLHPMESRTRARSTFISGWVVSSDWWWLFQPYNRYISSVIMRVVMEDTKLLETLKTLNQLLHKMMTHADQKSVNAEKTKLKHAPKKKEVSL